MSGVVLNFNNFVFLVLWNEKNYFNYFNFFIYKVKIFIS